MYSDYFRKPSAIMILFMSMISLTILYFYNNSVYAQKASKPQNKSAIAALLNNRANRYLELMDENPTKLDTAIIYYQKAIQLAPEDAGIKLNLGIASFVQEDSLAADSLFREAWIQTGKSLKKVFNLLSMSYDESKEEKALARNISENAIRQAIIASTGKKPKKGQRPAGPKKLDPGDVKKFLYIKVN